MLSFLTAVLAASAATAHFTLDYPETRGFDEDKETQFCGGFNTAATRQPFPLKGPVWIDNHHAKATVDAFVSLSTNPQSFDDFNKTSNGTAIPELTKFFQVSQGEACWNIDFSSLDLGLKNGSEVTMQVRFNGGDGSLYQCSDLVLLSDFEVPSNWTCKNDAASSSQNSTTSGGSSASSSSPSSASTGSNKSSASPVLTNSGPVALFALAIAALI